MLTHIFWNWGPWVFNKYVNILHLGSNVYNSVQKGLYERDIWIFIYQSHIPIPEELFDTHHIEIDNIKWKATIEPPTFIDPRADISHKLKHIPYLGFSINIPGNEIIELSDWINEIKWSGTVEPSPQDIFSLWCCKNREPFLFYNNNPTIEIITETGNMIKKGLNEFTHSNIYENDDATKINGPNPNRHMDIVLSSSGR
jgi:hypothetical protein